MPDRADEPLFNCRWETIDHRTTCVAITLHRDDGAITTSWVRTLPIATLIDRHRRRGLATGCWTEPMTISENIHPDA